MVVVHLSTSSSPRSTCPVTLEKIHENNLDYVFFIRLKKVYLLFISSILKRHRVTILGLKKAYFIFIYFYFSKARLLKNMVFVSYYQILLVLEVGEIISLVWTSCRHLSEINGRIALCSCVTN